MLLNRIKSGLALAAVTAELLLILTIEIRAEEPKLWVDPTANFSPAISDWPVEVVPIYPGAKPMECAAGNKCSPNPGIYPNPSSGLEVDAGYSLIVNGVSSQQVRQWYDGQLPANHWTLAQTKSPEVPKYEKCWDPNGIVTISIATSPMGNYPGAPTLLVLMLEKTKKHPEISQCGETVKDSFPGPEEKPDAGTQTKATKLCSLTGEPAEEALRLKSKLQKSFGIDICESDLCDAGLTAPPSGSTTPWLPETLEAVQTTLELLNQSCFLKSARVESICKSGAQEKEMCSGGFSAYASPTDHGVVFCYDRWSFNDQKKTMNEFYGEGTELLQQLLVHEIGHVYWRNPDGSLNFDKVSSWLLGTGYLDCTTMLGCLGVVGGGFATPPPEAPTEYAETSPAEDFAESVRFYVTQPDKLRERSPSRYRYLKENTFCGYEYGSN